MGRLKAPIFGKREKPGSNYMASVQQSATTSILRRSGNKPVAAFGIGSPAAFSSIPVGPSSPSLAMLRSLPSPVRSIP